MLQRAYGSDRARVIQPERGMFVTHYFFSQWLPLVGASAANVILAARSMCYWNPLTGELRNQVETEMGELAYRAAVSVRTVKDVLNQELVKRYFPALQSAPGDDHQRGAHRRHLPGGAHG